MSEIPQEVLDKKNSQINKKYSNPFISNIEMGEFQILNNGDWCIVSEEYYITTYNTQTSFVSFANYGDVYAVSGNINNGLSWMHFIPKVFDSGVRVKYKSHASISTGAKLFILFNVDPDYFSFEGNVKYPVVKSENKSTIAVAEISQTGNMTIKEFMNDGNPVYKIRDESSNQVSRDELLLYIENYRAHRFGLVKFSE